MYVDYHTHILPKMDDGAKDVDTSLEMIKMLKSQGVDTIVSTSHFYSHRESIASFKERRKKRYEEIMERNPEVGNIILGAEVAIEMGLSEKKGLETLRMGDTEYILLELPYAPYSSRIEEEITNIQLGLGLTPIIAHINRYTASYTENQMKSILELSGVVYQINNEVFKSWGGTRFVMNLIKQGYPLIFGSDTHNTDSRKPNFDDFVEEYCSYVKT